MIGDRGPRQGRGRPIRAATISGVSRNAESLARLRVGQSQTVVDGVPLAAGNGSGVTLGWAVYPAAGIESLGTGTGTVDGIPAEIYNPFPHDTVPAVEPEHAGREGWAVFRDGRWQAINWGCNA